MKAFNTFSELNKINYSTNLDSAWWFQCNISKYKHRNPILKFLHWLPVQQRMSSTLTFIDYNTSNSWPTMAELSNLLDTTVSAEEIILQTRGNTSWLKSNNQNSL